MERPEKMSEVARAFLLRRASETNDLNHRSNLLAGIKLSDEKDELRFEDFIADKTW